MIRRTTCLGYSCLRNFKCRSRTITTRDAASSSIFDATSAHGLKNAKLSSVKSTSSSHEIDLIQQMVKDVNCSIEETFEVCRRLQKQGLNAFQAAVEAASGSETDRETNMIYVRELVKECRDLVNTPKYFLPLLMKSRNGKEVLEILREDMKGFQFPPDLLSKTFINYVWPKMSTESSFEIASVIKELLPLGYSVPFIWTTYIQYFIHSGQYKKAISVLRVKECQDVPLHQGALIKSLAESTAATEFSVDDTIVILKEVNKRNSDFYVSQTNGIFLDHFVKNFARTSRRDKSFLDLLLERMSAERMVISEEQYNRLMTNKHVNETQLHVFREMTVTNRPVISASQKSGLDEVMLTKSTRELEDYLHSLLSTRTTSTDTEIRSVTCKLIIDYITKGVQSVTTSNPDEKDSQWYLNKVKELTGILKSNRMTISGGMKSTLFEFYATFGDFESSKTMQREIPLNFVINDFKVMNVAKFFIKAGRCSEAVDILTQELEKRKKMNFCEPSFTREQTKRLHIANFISCLDAAAYTRDPEFVKKIFDLCCRFRLTNHEGKSSNPTKGMLGSRVKVHLLRNDLDSAINEFSNLIEEYQQTPFIEQLMKRAIEEGKKEKLKEIIELSKRIHGKHGITVYLAFAYMRSGNYQDAVSLLSKSSGIGLKVMENHVSTMIERREVIDWGGLRLVLSSINGLEETDIQRFLMKMKVLQSNNSGCHTK